MGFETLKAFFEITTFNESKLLYPLIIRIKGNCYIRVIYLTYPYLPMPDSQMMQLKMIKGSEFKVTLPK